MSVNCSDKHQKSMNNIVFSKMLENGGLDLVDYFVRSYHMQKSPDSDILFSTHSNLTAAADDWEGIYAYYLRY